MPYLLFLNLIMVASLNIDNLPYKKVQFISSVLSFLLRVRFIIQPLLLLLFLLLLCLSLLILTSI